MRLMPTGAHVIVNQLEDAGVEVCFGLPGVHNLALWDALRESSIRLIGVLELVDDVVRSGRHEPH